MTQMKDLRALSQIRHRNERQTDFMRRYVTMTNGLRGRPPQDLELQDIVRAVMRHRQLVAAARQLGCSSAYLHARLKEGRA